MIPPLLNEVCRKALTDYLGDPWRWPRENDLVVDLVQRIRLGLPEDERQVQATFENLGSKFQNVGQPTRLVPRVRTELKLNDDRFRVDIGVFRSKVVGCFFNNNGARDVTLKANKSDMEGLLEVKVFPDLYLFPSGQRCKWFGDIMKLDTLARDAVRGVLLLDTSLPLNGVGITYTRRRGTASLGRVEEPSLPCWPLRPEPFSVEVGANTATFEPTDAPRLGGLYLWALAVDRSSTPTFGMLLAHSDVKPFCWKVEVGASS
jgi:hypothetical protein